MIMVSSSEGFHELISTFVIGGTFVAISDEKFAFMTTLGL